MSVKVAIATMTLARDAAEEALLRQSMAALVRTPLPVVVADGGSSRAFVEYLSSLAGVRCIEPSGKGLVPQVQAAVKQVFQDGADLILYTEPDKLAFFETGVAQLMGNGIRAQTLTLASRDAQSFATFPPVQQHTERAINDLCSEVLGVQGDYSYGPFVMDRSLVRWIAELPPDVGWGWRHATFAMAHRAGHRIVHSAGRFECPEDQRREDPRERLHRLRQLDQNISGLQVGLSMPLMQP